MDSSVSNRFCILGDRGVLALEGAETHEFLQNLVTNNIDPVKSSAAVYTALLSPQGKYLFDFFVIPWRDQLLLDCPLARKDELLKRLKLYRLRAKIDITDLSGEFDVAVVFGAGAGAALGLAADGDGLVQIGEGIAYNDPRTADAGVRIVGNGAAVALSALGFSVRPETDYDSHRLKMALPQSGTDLVVDKTIALEANLDFLNGVDFGKGCFVGQEVTARTKYRGLARKRLLPIRFEGAGLPVGQEIVADGRAIGETRSSRDGYGLALMRLDRLKEAEIAGHDFSVDGNPVTIIRPDWMVGLDGDN